MTNNRKTVKKEEPETRVEINPETGEISTVFNDEEMVAQKQLWDKNPKRTMAMRAFGTMI